MLVDDDRPPARIWPLVWTNAYSFLLQTLQVGLVGPFITLKLAHEQYSPAFSGFLVAIIWGLVIVLSNATPAVIRRLGVFPSNYGSIGLTVLGFVCLALFDNAPAYVVGAILIGVALTVRWISYDTLVIRLSSAGLVGRNVGIHETLMGGGIAVGPLILWLSNLGFSFVLCGVAGVALVATATLCACLICITRLDDDGDTSTDQMTSGEAKSRAVRTLRLALLCAFTAGFIEASFVAFLPAFVAAHGYTAAAGGLAGFLFGLGGTLLQPAIGRVADRIHSERAQLYCVAMIVATLAALIAVTRVGMGVTGAVFDAVVFLAGGFIGGANTLAVIDCGRRLDFPLIEHGVARIATAYTVGAVAGPLTIGVAGAAVGRPALISTCALFAGTLLLILYCSRTGARG